MLRQGLVTLLGRRETWISRLRQGYGVPRVGRGGGKGGTSPEKRIMARRSSAQQYLGLFVFAGFPRVESHRSSAEGPGRTKGSDRVQAEGALRRGIFRP
jgi:hypothetical protein